MPSSRTVSLCLTAAVAALLGCESPTLSSWPAELLVKSPSSQQGLNGYAVNDPPAVQLVDVDGKPVSGANVAFTITGGAGALTGAVAKTGSDGVATLGSWTVAPGMNTVVASVPAPFRVAPLSFTATGVAATYQITVSFLTTMSQSRRAVFDSAAARWGRMIYGDLPDISLSIPDSTCGDNAPAFSGTVDDLLIWVTLDSIDGPGAILGFAGPCWIRSTGKLPLIGAMVFDTADVAMLETRQVFDEVVLHEMAHVIGFGSLWISGLFNLVAGPAADGGTDPHFTGGQGINAFNRVGGLGYTASAKVPVENMGGPGTIDSHWRESVFGAELMTGFINQTVPNPLSIVSVASLRDEGYQVNYAAADPYSLSSAAAAAIRGPGGPAAALAAATIALGDDVLRLPIHLVDQRGRIVGVYHPPSERGRGRP